MDAPPFFSRFRTRLYLLVAMVVVPAFGLVLYGNLEQRRIERAAARERAVAISQLAAAHEDNFVKNTRQLLATLTQLPFLTLATNRQFCEFHFFNLRKLSPDYANFGLIEPNGLVFCSADAVTNPISLARASFFQRVKQTGRFAVGNLETSELDAEPVLQFGCPIVDERGRFVRVLFASLKLSRLSDAINRHPLPPGGNVFVVDRIGNVLAHSSDPTNWVGKSIANTSGIKPGTATVSQSNNGNGVPQLIAVAPVGEDESTGLFVRVGIPLAVSFAQSNQALVRNLALLALVAIGVLFAARFYAKRYFLQPIGILVDAAGKLAGGDLKARAGEIHGANELDGLGRALDDMAERLQKRQIELEQAHAEISELNRDLERRVRERTFELEASNKELESFSYSVSHDLRSPLRHVGAFAEMLGNDKGSNLSETGRVHLQKIAASTRHMGKLIDELLAFSRMGRTELRRDTVDLHALTQEVVAECSATTSDRDVVWKIARLPKVQCDGAMLRQALVNLVDNALKYSSTRRRAEIEIGCTEKPGEVIVFIKDNGVGFDMQYVDKLFGVFQRLHNTEDFDGIGVGLANVRRIITRHGGRVWAEGKVDGGATFYFTLRRDAKGG